MFANLYPNSMPEEAKDFSTAVDGRGENAAQVQGYVVFFKRSGRASIKNAFWLCTKPNGMWEQ